ncbi:unnamed protein product [Blepharisma stoltei]|uniref:Serine protease n=1 Tax=Blepharisma stoltei TaxID=1481888 RepID=A0AAU9JA20_9CILI|nr:unnamed protein product [Blepharisma stoltei]
MRRLFPFAFLAFGSYAKSSANESETILDRSLRGMFRISFIDKETLNPKGHCTGFFISNDGFGVTSSYALENKEHCKIMVKTYDSREFEAESSSFENVPGIEFIIIKSNTEKIPLTKNEIRDGDTAFVLGLKDKYPYFNEVYITDTQQPFMRKKDGNIKTYRVIKTTPQIPKECVGGPLLNEAGKVVGVVINLEHGFGASVPINSIKELNQGTESSWAVVKLWKSAREGLLRIIENKAN